MIISYVCDDKTFIRYTPTMNPQQGKKKKEVRDAVLRDAIWCDPVLSVEN